MTAHLKGTERVVVRLPKWLGDCVMAEPALAALAQYWRENGSIGKLSLVGPAHFLGLWDGRFSSQLSGVKRIDSKDQAGVGHALASADVALLFTGSFRSAFEAWRAQVPRRVGWSRDLRGLLLTDCMTPMLERGALPMMNTMALARGDWTGEDSSTPPSLGIRGRFPRYAPRPYGSTVIELVASLGIPVLRAKPLLQASEDVVQRIRKRLGDHGVDYRKPFIVLNVGSRPGSAKGWQGWSELASRLKGLVPMIAVGGPGEQPSLASFSESLAGEVGEAGPAGAPLVLDAPVLDLAELAALCADCQVFVTADAGARHIASAAGARTLALFGPTDPRHTADHLAQCTSLSKPVACGPCHREVCNASDQLKCFRGIGSQRVAASVESILLGHSAPSA